MFLSASPPQIHVSEKVRGVRVLWDPRHTSIFMIWTLSLNFVITLLEEKVCWMLQIELKVSDFRICLNNSANLSLLKKDVIIKSQEWFHLRNLLMNWIVWSCENKVEIIKINIILSPHVNSFWRRLVYHTLFSRWVITVIKMLNLVMLELKMVINLSKYKRSFWLVGWWSIAG